mmetsp:Transcript_11984/g.41585  ORF Transcript_11984/g.41585 Transcript_11984/m.41585 type:complete len:550 (+) Transcript_11984:180-1829(+)
MSAKLIRGRVAFQKLRTRKIIRATHAQAEGKKPTNKEAKRCEVSISGYLKGKTLFLTGATGFLAKVLLEKVLWEQPDINAIFLLITPKSGITAADRLQGQILSSSIFDRLRDRHGTDFTAVVARKLVSMDGDIGKEKLGLSPKDMQKIAQEADVFINAAATTAFDERLDKAIDVNTLGPQRLLKLAAQCMKLQMFCHVSTAFVSGMREGRVKEEPLCPGLSIAVEQGYQGADTLNLYEEIKNGCVHAAQTFRIEHAEDNGEVLIEKYLTEKLKILGQTRAKRQGWQDTYVFTKAMGEQLLVHHRGDIPLAIVRPSIVESAWSEPTPGWIEGLRMADPILVAYGKGHLQGFVGDRYGVLDMVPVDFVVNAMLATLPVHANVDEVKVYHVATSVANPLNINNFVQIVSKSFAEQPLKTQSGDNVAVRKMKIFRSREAFLLHNYLEHVFPAEVALLQAYFATGPEYRERTRQYRMVKKMRKQLTHFANIYMPYTFYAARFDTSETYALFESLSQEDQVSFNFDLNKIEWDHYLSRFHIPGIVTHLLKGHGKA